MMPGAPPPQGYQTQMVQVQTVTTHHTVVENPGMMVAQPPYVMMQPEMVPEPPTIESKPFKCPEEGCDYAGKE